MKTIIWYFTIRKRIGKELISSEQKICEYTKSLYRIRNKESNAYKHFTGCIFRQREKSDLLRKLL